MTFQNIYTSYFSSLLSYPAFSFLSLFSLALSWILYSIKKDCTEHEGLGDNLLLIPSGGKNGMFCTPRRMPRVLAGVVLFFECLKVVVWNDEC